MNLEFDDAVGVLFSKEAHRKLSGSAETLGSLLSINRRGRPMNRDKKKNGKSKSKLGRCISKSRGAGCWWCSEKGRIQRDYKQKKDGEGKSKENDSASQRVMDLLL